MNRRSTFNQQKPVDYEKEKKKMALWEMKCCEELNKIKSTIIEIIKKDPELIYKLMQQ